MVKKTDKKVNKLEKSKKAIPTNTIMFATIAIILIAFFCIAITPISLQNDTFYTIKIGELISNNGIDMMDHFSWHQNLQYTYPHWLYDFITYLIYNIWSLDGIYVSTCILSCILGISIYVVNAKLTKNTIVPFFITIGVLYLIKGYITARAQLVTFSLFIIAIYFIEMLLKTGKKRYGVRTSFNLIINCKFTLCSLAFFIHYIFTIYCRIFYSYPSRYSNLQKNKNIWYTNIYISNNVI